MNINIKRISIITFFITAFYEVFVKLRSIFDLFKAIYCPAKICWSWRLFITSSRHVLKTSSTCLQRDNFTSSKTSSWKTYLEDLLKTCLEDMSWRHVLKTSSRYVLKLSWRHYGDNQNTYWGYLYLTNLNVYLTNLYLTNLHLTILGESKMH